MSTVLVFSKERSAVNERVLAYNNAPEAIGYAKKLAAQVSMDWVYVADYDTEEIMYQWMRSEEL